MQACALAATLPPVVEWSGTAARLIGGRLANNVHAPRLARWLHGQTWRRDKASSSAAYYHASSLMYPRGTLATWIFLRALSAFPGASAEERADLLALRAREAGLGRDAEALEVNRRALELRRDHTVVTHQLWLAWHCRARR